MDKDIIKFTNATVGYKGKRENEILLRDLNLSFEEKVFYTILGASGVGKTTLLKTIVGLVKPLSGTVSVRGDASLLFQEPRLFPHMNVIENVMYPLKIAGITKDIREIEAKELLTYLGIEDKANKPIDVLSGGEAKRVALARALIRKPKILLLDEPLTNLDTNLKIIIRNVIRDIHKSFNLTTIMVTHDMFDAMMLSDKLVIIRNKDDVVITDTSEALKNESTKDYFSAFRDELSNISIKLNESR